MFKAIKSAVIESKEPHRAAQPERAMLQNSLEQQRKKAGGLPPFSDAVRHVNHCLITHNHHGLPSWKANQYKELTKGVTSGKVSNSSAFLTSSIGWGSEAFKSKSSTGRKEAIVGAVMNFGGFMASGAIDHQKSKGFIK